MTTPAMRTAAAAAALALATAAHAQLNGTVFEIEHDFADTFTQGEHTYGGTTIFEALTKPGQTWKATSPANQPGFDHSVLGDYTNFKPGAYQNTDTWLFFSGLDVQPEVGSAKVFNSAGKVIATPTVGDFGFFAMIPWNDVLAGPQPTIVVAWDSVGGADCYADCDQSGGLSLFDFLCFLGLFNSGQEDADCDSDGDLDLFDFLCFVGKFNAGC